MNLKTSSTNIFIEVNLLRVISAVSFQLMYIQIIIISASQTL